MKLIGLNYQETLQSPIAIKKHLTFEAFYIAFDNARHEKLNYHQNHHIDSNQIKVTPTLKSKSHHSLNNS